MSRIDALIAEHSCRYCGRLFADAERQFLGEIDITETVLKRLQKGK